MIHSNTCQNRKVHSDPLLIIDEKNIWDNIIIHSDWDIPFLYMLIENTNIYIELEII